MPQVMGVIPHSVGSCSELVATIIRFLAQDIILRVDLSLYRKLRKIDRIWAREASRIMKRLQEAQAVKALSNPDYIFSHPCCLRNPLLIDSLTLDDIGCRSKFLGCGELERSIFASLLWKYTSKIKKRKENKLENYVFLGGGVAVRAQKIIDLCEFELRRHDDLHHFFSVPTVEIDPDLEVDNYNMFLDLQLLENVNIGSIHESRAYPYALRLVDTFTEDRQVGDYKKCQTFIFAIQSPTEDFAAGGNYEFVYKLGNDFSQGDGVKHHASKNVRPLFI